MRFLFLFCVVVRKDVRRVEGALCGWKRDEAELGHSRAAHVATLVIAG
jgi:hypothetical protein